MKQFLFAFLLLITTAAQSQYIGWEYKINTIADNREYFNKFAKGQTILGVDNRFLAKVEVDTFHSVHAGFSVLLRYGYDMQPDTAKLYFYYQYAKKGVDISLGSIPRDSRIKYPVVLLSDSVDYFHPSIQGGVAKVFGRWGFQQIWIDWTGTPTMTRRESFLTGLNGQVKIGCFYIENYYYMFHNAVTLSGNPNEHIADNGCLAGYAGIDLSHKFGLDSLRFDAGVVSSHYRVRPEKYYMSAAVSARINMRYKRVGLDFVYYNGEQPVLPWGDVIYKAQKYGRIDFIWEPFKSKHVSSALKACFHSVDGALDVSQQILVSAKIGKDKIAVPHFID